MKRADLRGSYSPRAQSVIQVIEALGPSADERAGVLRTCLELLHQSVVSSASASDQVRLPEALDCLQCWLDSYVARYKDNSGAPTPEECGLVNTAQAALVPHIWTHLVSPTKEIATRSTLLLSTLLQVLPNEAPTSSSRGGSRLVNDLLERALDVPDYKVSITFFELMISSGDIHAFFLLQVAPKLYESFVLDRDANRFNAARRSKVATSLLRAHARRAGLRLSQNGIAQITGDAECQEAFRAWCQVCVPTLARALLDDDARGRAQLGYYHVAGLFEIAAQTLPVLLAHINAQGSSEASLPAVLTVVLAGRGAALCRIVDANSPEAPAASCILYDVPVDPLLSCAAASSLELHTLTLAIVVTTRAPVAPLTRPELIVLRKYFRHNLSINNSEARTRVQGLLSRLLDRLRASCFAASRDATKLELIAAHERTVDETVRLQTHKSTLIESHSFLEWLAAEASRLIYVGSPYFAIIAGLNLLDILLPVEAAGARKSRKPAGEALAYDFKLDLATPELVQRLLACANSSFVATQSAAFKLLTRFPAPLPGLDTPEAADTAILDKAAQFMLGARESESNAAGELSSLYLRIYTLRCGWKVRPFAGTASSPLEGQAAFAQPDHAFIAEHLSLLESHLTYAEVNEAALLSAAHSRPLHGTLIALQSLFASIDKVGSAEHLPELRALYERAVAAIDRVWRLTSAVLCASAPEGADPTTAPDHETARALAAAGEEDGDVGTGLGPAHQVLLSYAWRGMKEASALLGQIVAHCFAASRDATHSRALWTIEDVEGVGVRFSEWMTRVRHRGAFSTIGPSYALAASALVRFKSWPEAAAKPRAWLDSFLDAVEDPSKSLSITRRSAGIGYAVLALLSSFSADDSTAIDVTMERLMRLAAAEEPPSSASQIHAMNIIRVCVMDGSLTAVLLPFIGRLLALVVKRFSSQDWNIRNSSMMLFSALLARALPGKMTNLSLTAERVPIHQFFVRFPTLHAALLEQLETLSKAASSQRSGGDLGNGQSALFAVLLLISRMQTVDHVSQATVHAEPLKPLIETCMESPVWKLREVAADAFASVVQPSRALPTGVELLQRCSLKQQNGAHGRLLAVERLLRAAHKPSTTDISAFQTVFSDVSATWLTQNRCSATQAAFLTIGIAISLRLAGTPTLAVAESFTLTTLDASKSEALQSLLHTSAGPALLVACAKFQLQTSSATTARALLVHGCPDVRLEAVQHVADLESIADGKEIASALLKIFCSSVECAWIRTAAGHTLHRNFRSELIAAEGRHVLWRQVTEIAAKSESAPLRQAALPLLADLAAVQEEGEMSEEQIHAIETCCRAAAIGAQETQPVEFRIAALGALCSLRASLFPARLGALDATTSALFDARVAFICLLADDDESARHLAADAFAEALATTLGEVGEQADAGPLSKALDAAKHVSLGAAASIDRAWAWMSDAYSKTDSRAWDDYVWSILFVDDQTLQHDFESAFSSSAVLFAEDSPNQFRQPSDDYVRAAKHLFGIEVRQTKEQLCANLLCHCTLLERIADALQRITKDVTTSYEATHTLALRTILASRVLAHQLRSEELDGNQSSTLSKVEQLSKEIAQQLRLNLANVGGNEQSRVEQTSAKALQSPVRRMRIAMISDFFYPNVGGVEGHMYMLSQRLLQRGHKVIVITHAYSPDRTGIRHLPSGLKVYHIPYGVIARQDTLPQFFGLFPPLRSILLRERIEIVHGHQALSSMAHEGILHARAMGIRAVFTDHSLFGFADAASILTNKLLRFVLSDIDHVVCVSHIGKENTVLRAAIDPRKVSVIPNAVVASQFRPDPTRPDPTRLTIIVLSRLMYRKGIDLLIASIPRICELHPDVHFIIGGDGPKRIELEQMREKYFLHERVELAGAIRPGDVREHLVRGQIFLNTSLTEAFGTSIIEAACAGLYVVSTRVGGVPEVLPPWMSLLAAPDEDDVVRATEEAIAHIRSGKHDPIKYHEAVRSMYSWADVAERVEEVYDSAFEKPIPDSLDRLRSYYAGGPIAGKIFCIIVGVNMIFLFLLEWMMPAASIDCVPDVIDAHEAKQRSRSSQAT